MSNEAWWTCSECGAPITKVGKRHAFVWDDHRKVCKPLSGGFIKQWEQVELAEWRRNHK
jgi:hypothetical protein